MAIEFPLPQLGENITEADVVKVLVAAGDAVAVDQPLIEVETEKATLEVPAPTAGDHCGGAGASGRNDQGGPTDRHH